MARFWMRSPARRTNLLSGRGESAVKTFQANVRPQTARPGRRSGRSGSPRHPGRAAMPAAIQAREPNP
jgi:hypothetical protein